MPFLTSQCVMLKYVQYFNAINLHKILTQLNNALNLVEKCKGCTKSQHICYTETIFGGTTSLTSLFKAGKKNRQDDLTLLIWRKASWPGLFSYSLVFLKLFGPIR